MSKTPRTDDRASWAGDMGVEVVRATFARQLETELANKDKQLAEARAEIAALVAEFQRLADEPPTLEEIAADLDKIEMLEKELAERDKLIEQMREALQWYKEQVSSCNRNGDAGELARDRLAKDVGKRAEAALSAADGGKR